MMNTMTFALYLLFGFFISTYQNEISDYEYPSGILPCKVFDSSHLDCSYRDLWEIPPVPANITWIDLSRNYLQNISHDSFAEQGYLTDINLGDNYIQTIHGSPFMDLNAAQTLIVSHTLLDHLAPTSFRGLFNLLKLDLAFCYLRNLPGEIFDDLKKLQSLDIQFNYLTEVPNQSLSSLTSLQFLNMMFNSFFSLNFGEGFKNLISLTELRVRPLDLNVSRNGTSYGMAYYEHSHVVLDNDTFQYLAEIPLKSLAIIFNDVDNVTVDVEDGIFEPLKNLTYLYSFWGFRNAIPSLQGDIESLHLILNPNGMRLTNTTLEDLVKWKTSLRHLDLHYSGIDGIYGAAFASFSNLCTLNLTGVLYSMQYISDDAFQGLHNLEELFLGNNQINSLPVKAFQAFTNGSLKVLDLSYNALTGRFRDDHSFDSLSTLTHLNLSHNPIETVGKWIHALKNLQELRLNYVTAIIRIDFLDWTIPLTSLKKFCLSWPDLKFWIMIAIFWIMIAIFYLKRRLDFKACLWPVRMFMS